MGEDMHTLKILVMSEEVCQWEVVEKSYLSRKVAYKTYSTQLKLKDVFLKKQTSI